MYDAEEINRKLAILNNAREFDSINHELVQRGDEYGIRINATGRNWATLPAFRSQSFQWL
jgi:hypothetical protein